ncbi:hypothetical protein [Streptacidiphilus sp. PAMC 29251]
MGDRLHGDRLGAGAEDGERLDGGHREQVGAEPGAEGGGDHGHVGVLQGLRAVLDLDQGGGREAE